jgi:hypothetical protein
METEVHDALENVCNVNLASSLGVIHVHEEMMLCCM